VTRTHLLGLAIPREIRRQKPLAGVDLSIDARLTLLIRRVPCVDQNVDRTVGRNGQWFAKVHDAPPVAPAIAGQGSEWRMIRIIRPFSASREIPCAKNVLGMFAENRL
jgi:hypothetical protein